MAERGGYRKPTNPAPVSGPGRLARRTDGGPASQNVVRLPNAGYGESAAFEADQAGAAMSATPPPSAPTATGPAPTAGPDLGALLGGGGDPAAQAPVPLSAGTQMPDQPITAGAPIGAGPGPDPSVLAPTAGRISDTLERLTGGDLTGEIADMYADLRARGL